MGKVDILKTFFDEKDPLGLEVKSSRIIKCDVIGTSNQYLSDTLKISQVKESSLLFEPIIFESDQFIKLKLLVIHRELLTPSIVPLGKVAGVKKIDVQEESKSGTALSLWSVASGGNIFIQIIRVVLYGIAFIVICILTALLIAGIVNLLDIAKRKIHVKNFKEVEKRKHSACEELMFKKYIYHGENFVISLEQLLSSKISLKREITNLKLRRSKPDKEKEYDLFDTRLAAAFILDNRIATTTKDGLEIHDQDILNIIKEFLDFLKKYIPQKIDKARSQRGMFSFELTSDD